MYCGSRQKIFLCWYHWTWTHSPILVCQRITTELPKIRSFFSLRDLQRGPAAVTKGCPPHSFLQFYLLTLSWTFSHSEWASPRDKHENALPVDSSRVGDPKHRRSVRKQSHKLARTQESAVLWTRSLLFTPCHLPESYFPHHKCIHTWREEFLVLICELICVSVLAAEECCKRPWLISL